MENTALLLRFMQFYAHIGHNKIYGPLFLIEHDYLGELYGAYEEAYDSVIERIIGLGGSPDLISLHKKAAEELSHVTCNSDAHAYFKTLLAYEVALCQSLAAAQGNMSEGTKQMLGGLCDASEMRQYKLKQITRRD